MRGSLRSRKRGEEDGDGANRGNGGAAGGSGRGKDGEGQPSTKRSKQEGPRTKLRTCVALRVVWSEPRGASGSTDRFLLGME